MSNTILRFGQHDDRRVSKPLIVVGAGLVGLSVAIDLAQKGIPVIVLDIKKEIIKASRAICYSKESLSYFDKIGIYKAVMQVGVSWKRAKVYYQNSCIVDVDLDSHKSCQYPAYVNLQQFYVEEFLMDRAQGLKNIDLRLGHKVIGIKTLKDTVQIEVISDISEYKLESQYLLAADGVHSFVRNDLDLELRGKRFQDKYLVIDFYTEQSMANERSFWFDPEFSEGCSALLLPQANKIWRLDFQVGPNANDKYELGEKNLNHRMKSMFGEDFMYEIKHASIYRFSCRRMKSFRDKNVFFLGDAAHVVSPFGARGANSGFQDAENIAWRLDHVINRGAHDRLLDGYSLERTQAADQNIEESTRSTNFISPVNNTRKTFRNAILKLAKKYDFALKTINCGKLYSASTYFKSDFGQPGLSVKFCCDIQMKTGSGTTWLHNELDDRLSIILFSRYKLKLINTLRKIRKLFGESQVKEIPILVGDERINSLLGSLYYLTADQLVKTNFLVETILLIRPDKYVCTILSLNDYLLIPRFIGCFYGEKNEIYSNE